MNIWLIISGVASLVVVLMCVAILLGRGDWLVYELRGDDRDKFNLARLRVVIAVEYLLMVLFVWVSHIFDFKDWISLVGIVLIAILAGLMKSRWAMR